MSSKESKSVKKEVTAIVIGAGNRGSNYAEYGSSGPHPFKVVGVAEPRDGYREKFVRKHNVPKKNVFKDWKDVVKREKFADCVLICTQDNLHKDPAVAFAKMKYHILLEKPMAPTEAECKEIVETCKSEGILLQVCHVLKYSPWAMKIKEVIDSGRIGDVVNIQHLEPVGHWHFAHSYVRGNWHKEADSSNSLLAKCCHDLDLINYWMGPKNRCEKISSFGNLSHFTKEHKVGHWHFAHSFVRGNWCKVSESSCSLLQKCCHDLDLIMYWMGRNKCERISSFGNLSHFTKENKPKGAADRCLDCPSQIERLCPYSAKKCYLERVLKRHTGWPVSVLEPIPDIENITEALRTGPYGKCVYDCDNDVMSNQVVNMQFKDGATANMTMIAFTNDICDRKVKVFGTKGELNFGMGSGTLILYDFTRGDHDRISTDTKDVPRLSGHGGADFYCIGSFIEAIANNDPGNIVTGPDETLYSHMLVFAAEKARKENKVVMMQPDGSFS